MTPIEFSSEERAFLVARLQAYFDDEMGMDLGSFQCEFLLDFINNELGPRFYNRGILDAQAVVTKQFEHLADSLYQLESASRTDSQ
jgi:uncharacterized protein (DUF2164 family)